MPTTTLNDSLSESRTSRERRSAERTVYVHPSAICESSHVGDGTRVWAFAHIMDGAIVGRQCNIADHVFIESGARVGDRVTIKNAVLIFKGVTIEDDVFVGPAVVFTNDRYPRSPRMPQASGRYERLDRWLTSTLVRRGASVGAGAVILPGITLGSYATVGAGAVVTRDVADHRLVLGNPARPVGWMCFCGRRLGESYVCEGCRRRFRMHNDVLRPVD